MELYGTYRKSVHHYGHTGEIDFYMDGWGFNGKDIKNGPKIIKVVVGHKKSLS